MVLKRSCPAVSHYTSKQVKACVKSMQYKFRNMELKTNLHYDGTKQIPQHCEEALNRSAHYVRVKRCGLHIHSAVEFSVRPLPIGIHKNCKYTEARGKMKIKDNKMAG